ncbi:MAG: ABC transporter substrate-binding protein [Candidatus Rokubacteria bacterium]|nr:ABC transporter substrate-binding protein [Candidatus Rokubacteria bacterium]
MTESVSRRRFLTRTAAAGAVVAAGQLGFPALLRAQDVIKLGHLTPRTGFLAQLGEYGFRGASLAVEEVNAAGGALGRKLELIAEDSVNPQTAVTKAQKLLERDRVVVLIGEINSASALAIAEQVARYKMTFFNTGANSDALRGKNCNRFMFHVEGCNTMYTKTIGTWQKAENKIRGAKWYMLTADYAFGHDLFRVSSRFLTENGGVLVTNEMVPTNTPDYSAYILKIRQARPDFVYLNLAGADQTTFLKQYKEYNLPFPLAGGVMDTVPFWAAGIDSLSGNWQSLWYHGLTIPAAQAFTKKYGDKHGGPPDNQAWGDYVGVRIVAQSIAETKSTEPAKLIEHLEKGASFDILKARRGTFRAWDHQLLQEMYVVRVKDKASMKDKWDIFDVVRPVPAAGESLELIQPTREENPCTMA